MITPHKYLNLDLSILHLGGVMLALLKSENIIKYDALLDKIIVAYGENAKIQFIPTLSFLYLLGKIDYQKNTDTIIFVKSKTQKLNSKERITNEA